MRINLFLFIIYILFLTSSHSSENQTKLLKVYKNLRCLVCQGQSIADSNSDFAATIKLVVQDQFSAGKTEEDIYEFLTSKYGEWIVYQPTFSKNNFLLWVLPYIALIFGALIIFFIVRKNKQNKVN
ncbi:cytochrome c-type biogenesis protein CcmH [Pelagibacteraceae bacterium]|jgi:cytochrome c-type biogenesis protein CcmH|nr:cytochrome c-type biogenesis protein CcmH [Pelagibacteraceae bacterium]|tara:strand:- start:804 stop:1181 length:378 start_codon:yes stop_codon:yes gene_type:complete